MSSDLNTSLLAAHAARDGPTLARLYARAAAAASEPDAAAFYLTHAWIWALDSGAPEADALYAQLADHGRV